MNGSATSPEEKLGSVFENNRKAFEPFISAIWFPHYKSLEDGFRIEFTWPITAIVGPNGTNKTSILHALAAAPESRSIAEYWFSTKLDDIDKWGGGEGAKANTDPHRFVYSYGGEPGQAECRKARVTRKFRGKDVPERLQGKADPDYWEPTKPAIRDGMKKFEADPSQDNKHQDRWALIKKPILFLDLKAEISAFDKFLNHSSPDRFTDTSTKKRIRAQARAARLDKALKGDTTAKDILSRVLEGPRSLDREAVKEISTILGKDIDGIDVIKHTLFGAPGTTFRLNLKSSSIEYSEAHAGSGEFTVVRLVDEIHRAPSQSLILLDEPEISLHPGAQERFMDFLMRKALAKKLQVVLSTHSPAIVDTLPSGAIKVLGFDDVTHQVKLLAQSCSPSEAFNALGFNPRNNTHLCIYLEDELTKEIVEASLRRKRPNWMDLVEIQIIPGGASSIVRKVLPVLAMESNPKTAATVILLDGDQKKPAFEKFLGLSDFDLDTHIRREGFEKTWDEYVHETEPEKFIHCDASNAQELESGLINFARTRLGFLGDSWPERMLAEQIFPDDFKEAFHEGDSRENESGKSWKLWWLSKTADDFKLSASESPSAKQTFEYQKVLLNTLREDNPIFDMVVNEIERIANGFV